MRRKLFEQREDMFVVVGHPFTIVSPETLFMIRDRLILRHRRHKGFALSKKGVLECDECDLIAEQTNRGWMCLSGNTTQYIVGMNASDEEADISGRVFKGAKFDEQRCE